MKSGVVDDGTERLPPKLCVGCGEPTYVELVEDEERWPLCNDCAVLLDERPEARELLLAETGATLHTGRRQTEKAATCRNRELWSVGILAVALLALASAGQAQDGSLSPAELSELVRAQGGGFELPSGPVALGMEVQRIDGFPDVAVRVTARDPQTWSYRRVRFVVAKPGDELAFSNGDVHALVRISEDGSVATMQSITYKEGEVMSSTWCQAGVVIKLQGP